MFSALSSLIWGTTEEENSNIEATQQNTITGKGCGGEHVEIENEWIYIQPGEKPLSKKTLRRAGHMEESWLVTPPQCFDSNIKKPRTEMNPMENLLIEHPSMSIYHGSEEKTTEKQELVKSKCDVPARRDTHKAVAGRLLALEKRQPLKDLNKTSSTRKQNSPKNMKRKNQVYVRQHGARKNKQYGRQTGKHTALVGKRAS